MNFNFKIIIMKRILLVVTIFGSAFFLLSSFSIRETPQAPPRGKKTEKHIKLEKVDESGNKLSLDTIIEGDVVFVWNGDTIGGSKDLKWITKDDFVMDSLHKNMKFDIDITDDGEGKVFIMKSGKKNTPFIYEFKSDGDSAKEYK